MEKEIQKFIDEWVVPNHPSLNIHGCYELGYYAVGDKFMVTPKFLDQSISYDEFFRTSFFNRCGEIVIDTMCFHLTDIYQIVKIRKKRTHSGDAVLRVKNLRLDIDFNLLKDDVALNKLDTLSLLKVE